MNWCCAAHVCNTMKYLSVGTSNLALGRVLHWRWDWGCALSSCNLNSGPVGGEVLQRKKKMVTLLFFRDLYLSDVAGHHVNRHAVSSHPSVLVKTAVPACYPSTKYLIPAPWGKTESFPWWATWAKVFPFCSGVMFKDTTLWRLRKYHMHCCFAFTWVLLGFETAEIQEVSVGKGSWPRYHWFLFFFIFNCYSSLFHFSLEGSCLLSL